MLREAYGHTFVDYLIPMGGTVVDLGGNHGDFTRSMRSIYDARVLIVEPVPELFNNLPKDEKITNVQAAISGKNGQIEIFLPEDRCATVRPVMGGKSITVREYKYSDLIADYKIEKIDLLKIDIECAEFSLIESLSADDFKKLIQCSVEFHDFLYFELKPKAEELKKKFEANGFYCISFSLTTNGDVLFIRRDMIPFLTYFYVKYVLRFWRGFLRKIKK